MRISSLLPLLAASPAITTPLEAVERGKFTRRDIVEIERSIQARNLVEEIWDKIKSAATCGGCEGILLLLKGVALLGDSAFISVGQGICKLAKIQDDDVCDGAVALEGPAVAEIIRKMDLGSRTSKLFCSSVVGLCPFPEVEKWSVPFPTPKPAGGRPVPSGKTPLKVVHFSDVHVDLHYVAGSNTQCNKPICCRAYTENDAPGKTKNPAGPNGDHKCDTPLTLEDSMYKAIKEAVPDAVFSIFTGDIVDHTIWNTSVPYNQDEINSAYRNMGKYLGTVYGTAGNHEQHPTNLFQPDNVGSNSQWVYNLLSGIWSQWTGGASTSSIQSLGAYSAKPPQRNVRVISLNTNMYYKANFWLYQNDFDKDPNGQFGWLVQELDAAEKANENVYIIGHMPMGDSDAFHDSSNYFDQIVNRYSNTIAALFFGHTHVDHFEITYSNYSARSFSTAKAMSYISPSLTPTSGMPSFRVYEVDPDTFGVLDSITYIADMSNADFQTKGPVWTKYYSAKETYGAALEPPVTDPKAELTPAFWHNVTAKFASDSALFNSYISRKSRGWKNNTCTGDCETAEICQLRAGRSQDNCYVPKPGFNLFKRDAEPDGHGKHDRCGVSIGAETFSALSSQKELLEFLQEEFNMRGAKLPGSLADFVKMMIPDKQKLLAAGLALTGLTGNGDSVSKGKVLDYAVEKCIDADGNVRCSKPFLVTKGGCYSISWTTDGALSHTTVEVRDAGSDEIVYYRDTNGDWTPDKGELVYLDFKPKVWKTGNDTVEYEVKNCPKGDESSQQL